MTDDAPAETVERREGPYGEVALRRRGEGYEIIANGCFLMDTTDGRSERLLVDAALDALPGVERPSLLLGGLGVGFSLAAAARSRWGRITVVERERAVVDWHREAGRFLAPFSEGALDDPRVAVVLADLVEYVAGTGDAVDAAGPGPADSGFEAARRFDAVCLDIDNGPDWTVDEGNSGLYGDGGLLALRRLLAPGGVLAVWGSRPCEPFAARLREYFGEVRALRVEVARGAPDVVYMGRRND